MRAYERVAQFDTSANVQRVFDIDRFGREVETPMEWRPCKTAGNTSASHLELWEDALILVSNYRAGSRIVIGSVVEFRRYL